MTFHFRGDVRSLLTRSPRLRHQRGVRRLGQAAACAFDIQDVNFATALRSAAEVTKTFWIPLTPSRCYFLADTVENRRSFERLALQTFYLPDATDQQLAEMTNSLRVLLNLRFIVRTKRGHHHAFAPSFRCWKPPNGSSTA